MSNHSKATLEQLENLHGTLAETLAEKLKSGEVDAATLGVARQFLKDNGIDAVPTEGSGLGKLAESLPFQPTEEG
jgi:hypothetical protein